MVMGFGWRLRNVFVFGRTKLYMQIRENKKKNEKTVIVWKVPPLDGMLYAVKLLTKNTSANILG